MIKCERPIPKLCTDIAVTLVKDGETNKLHLVCGMCQLSDDEIMYYRNDYENNRKNNRNSC